MDYPAYWRRVTAFDCGKHLHLDEHEADRCIKAQRAHWMFAYEHRGDISWSIAERAHTAELIRLLDIIATL